MTPEAQLRALGEGRLEGRIKSLRLRVVTGAEAVPIGRGRCRFVMIQNPIANQNGSNNPSDLYIGTPTQQIIQITPGTASPLLPWFLLEELYVKAIVAAAGDLGYVDVSGLVWL